MIDITGGATPLRANEEQYTEDGIKFLRIQNVTEFGIDLNNIKYVTEDVHNGILCRSQLRNNDLLFTITGRIGTAAIVTNSILPANINQHIARLTIDESKACLPFLCYYLNSNLGQLLSNRGVTGTTRLALDYNAIKSIPIPCVEIEKQRLLADKMSKNATVYLEKLAQADELLRSMDEFVNELLGFSSSKHKNEPCWIVQYKSIIGKRLDANSYKRHETSDFTAEIQLMPLKHVAHINANEKVKSPRTDDIVPYVGLPECSLTEVETVIYRPYLEVRGRNIVIPDDILFARIEPSVFNKKYVHVKHLYGNEYAYVSTEFYTVRADRNIVLQQYLYSILFSSYVYSQISGKTTGSSGRRRIDKSMFEDVLIPVPSKSIQQEIANEAIRRRTLARQLKEEAEKEWQVAKKQFEKEILGEVSL